MPGIGGTQIFTKIVGEKKALRHILTGEGLTAS
jgi:enoyl-CoA hydratase/carnithine racemase